MGRRKAWDPARRASPHAAACTRHLSVSSHVPVRPMRPCGPCSPCAHAAHAPMRPMQPMRPCRHAAMRPMQPMRLRGVSPLDLLAQQAQHGHHATDAAHQPLASHCA